MLKVPIGLMCLECTYNHVLRIEHVSGWWLIVIAVIVLIFNIGYVALRH